jgi:phosphoribosyl 1,2-cyclic phosphate phosphodiesterase
MFTYAFDGQNRYRGYVKPEPHAIAGPFAVGATLVTPLPVDHGKVETVGFLFTRGGVKRLAYIPDCKRLSPVAAEAVRGVGTLVLDALRFTDHVTHMTIAQATEAALAAAPGVTYLIHFSDEVSHARDEARLPEGVHLSYDGLRIRC